MQDNPRSEPTPDQIKSLLQEAILRNYPNPERRGCSDRQSLKGVVDKRLPHEDPLWQHISHCSPCYQDFLELRAVALNQRRARRRVAAIAGGCAALALTLAVWFFAIRPAPKVPSNDVGRAATSALPGSTTTKTLTAVLNMQASPVRGSEPARSAAVDLQQLPRGQMAPLFIYLPFGSDAGKYKVELLRDGDNRAPLATFSGSAEIRDGLTVLRVSPDLSHFGPGTYVFSVSQEPGNPWTCRFVLR